MIPTRREAALFNLLDLALTAAAAGIEHKAILDKVQQMQDANKTEAEIADAIRVMRDQALEDAQKAIDAAS